MRNVVLIAHNVRSAHNVGSLLRTAEGLGVRKVYLTGYTPFPATKDDPRLPHEASKIDKQITKTALGAEKTLDWEHAENIGDVLDRLRSQHFHIAAVEQAQNSTPLPEFQPPNQLAILVGNEVDGLDSELLTLASTVLEIPMFGQKESFNVVQAAAMTLYHCTFR